MDGSAARREAPERQGEFAGVSLDELRAYRKDLADEESRVSYWRRLLQARSDIVGGATLDRMMPVRNDSVAGAQITVAGHRIDVASGAVIDAPPAAGSTSAGGGFTPTVLKPLRAGQQVVRLRTALLTTQPAPGLPPLPDLVRLWELPQPQTPAERTALVAELERAEAELSAYRKALHQRLDACTTELIARYREHPELCLSALPGGQRLGD